MAAEDTLAATGRGGTDGMPGRLNALNFCSELCNTLRAEGLVTVWEGAEDDPVPFNEYEALARGEQYRVARRAS